MQPFKIEFYVYAESQEEVEQAQVAAREFVKTQYNRGRIVSARRLADAMRNAQNNPLISNILTE